MQVHTQNRGGEEWRYVAQWVCVECVSVCLFIPRFGSGSFVRPRKVTLGYSFIEALKKVRRVV